MFLRIATLNPTRTHSLNAPSQPKSNCIFRRHTYTPHSLRTRVHNQHLLQKHKTKTTVLYIKSLENVPTLLNLCLYCVHTFTKAHCTTLYMKRDGWSVCRYMKERDTLIVLTYASLCVSVWILLTFLVYTTSKRVFVVDICVDILFFIFQMESDT